jgi:parallel beta-helix repeat protein
MAVLDRSPNANRRTPQRSRDSRKISSLLVILVVASSLVTTMLLQKWGPNDTLPESPLPARVRSLAHSPIYINGNTGFLGPNASTGISWGSGTSTDPYIISGWDIDAHNGEYAISVSNSDAYAVIRDCILCNASENTIPYGNGLTLENVRNMVVENNNISMCYTAIFMDFCNQNVIRNNTLHDTTHMGLQMYSNNNHNLIQNNTIYGIGYDGICLWSWSENNTVTGNWIHSNTFSGINVRYANGNVIVNNLLEDNQNSIEVYYSYVSNLVVERNTIRNSNCGVRISGENNTVRGNLVETCPWGINLWECNRSTVELNVIQQCLYGVWGQGSSDDTIVGNKLDSSEIGVMLENSNGWVMTGNRFENNTWYAISLDQDSSDNFIYRNDFWYNNGVNDSFNVALLQAYDDGMNNHWDHLSSGNFWCDLTVEDTDHDGYVDAPYPIDGDAGAEDSFPLTMPLVVVPEFPGPATLIALLCILAVIGLTISSRRNRNAP